MEECNSRLIVNTSNAIRAVQETIRTKREIAAPSGTAIPLESADDGFEKAERSESPVGLPVPAAPTAPPGPLRPESNRETAARDIGRETAASHRAWRAANSFPAGPRAIAGQT